MFNKKFGAKIQKNAFTPKVQAFFFIFRQDLKVFLYFTCIFLLFFVSK